MINPNEAPEGYFAVPETGKPNSCHGCEFETRANGCDGIIACSSIMRRDGHDVIFKKKLPGKTQAEIDELIDELIGEDQ